MFRADTEAVRLNRRSDALPPEPALFKLSNPPTPPRPAGPGAGAAGAPPAAAAAAFRVARAAFFDGPNPQVLASRRSTLKNPGPLPKSRGSMASPGAGFGSSRPYEV